MDSQRLTNKLRSWLPLLPLALLLSGSYWLSLQVQPLSPHDKQVRHDVDFTIEKLSSTVLNEQGAPRFTLSAAKMWHFADDDTTHLELPRFTSFAAQGALVNVSAKSGILANRSEEVFMSDEVLITRTDLKTKRDMRFETEFLHIIPELDTAKTDRPVRMTNKDNTVHATGMILDNQARTIQLLSQVRAKHEAPR